MWWAVVTLTTTGYGDVVPLTPGGRIIGALLMISGIAVLALMTGVLATGFAQEERRREISPGLGPGLARADLRVAGRRYPVRDRGQAAHALLPAARHGAVRRGDAGDSMFFISTSEVEVRLPDRRHRSPDATARSSARCRCSSRQPRAASIATTKPTTLLVLYASDFYEIASHISKPRRSGGKRGEAPARGKPRAPVGRGPAWRLHITRADQRNDRRPTCWLSVRGAAGFSAALTASHAGLSVLMVEKEKLSVAPRPDSAGVIWIPANRHGRALGIADSKKRRSPTCSTRPATGRTSNSPTPSSTTAIPPSSSIDNQHARARTRPCRSWADYHPTKPGAAQGGRSLLLAAVYDGRRSPQAVRPIARAAGGP